MNILITGISGFIGRNLNEQLRRKYSFKVSSSCQRRYGFYTSWKLSYEETLLREIVQKGPLVWHKYDSGLCKNAESLQPRMLQSKANYWNLDKVCNQTEILK